MNNQTSTQSTPSRRLVLIIDGTPAYRLPITVSAAQALEAGKRAFPGHHVAVQVVTTH